MVFFTPYPKEAKTVSRMLREVMSFWESQQRKKCIDEEVKNNLQQYDKSTNTFIELKYSLNSYQVQNTDLG